MDNIVINIPTFISICAGLGTVYGAYKIIHKPLDALNERFTKYDQLLANDKTRLDGLQDLSTGMKKDMDMIGDMTYQILDHMSTNNNTGGMKDTLDKYNAYYRKK